jgi:sugar-specific transcriptional regulator TrmB
LRTIYASRGNTCIRLGGCNIQEDLVKKLTQFGFTTNQAKVYLSIVQAGAISAGKIAKLTMLHRQDIYKILPKLEKNGLITKTIGKPFRIQAVPVETALYQLVLNEKEKSNRKIASLECNIKNLVESLKEPQKNEEDIRFTLLTTDESIWNTAYQAVRLLKKEVKLVTSPEMLLTPLVRLLQEIVSSPAEIKLSILVETNSGNTDSVAKMFEKLNLAENRVIAKGLTRQAFKHYLILDRKEVWIATEQKTESGFPNIFWTNDKNIVQVYEEYFDKGWNHSKATTIYPKDTELMRKRNFVIA